MKTELEEFLEKHNACTEGRAWALATGATTINEIWQRDDMRKEWRIWIADRVLTKKQQTALTCRFVREIWHLLRDDRSWDAIEVAEKWVAGEATDEELDVAAYTADYIAAYTADYAAAYTDDYAAAYAARAAACACVADAYSTSTYAAYAARAVNSVTYNTASKRQCEIMVEMYPTI